MANLKDLIFIDKDEYREWINKRVTNAFELLKKNKQMELYLAAYNTRAFYDKDLGCYCANIDYDYIKENTHFYEDITEEEIYNLDTLEGWDCLLSLMSTDKWMSLKARLSTDEYIEVCLAGWLYSKHND